jgi:hypothetical protein
MAKKSRRVNVDRIKLGLIFGFLAMPFAHAQVTVEIAKITC